MVFHHLRDTEGGSSYYVQPCASGGFFVTSLLDKQQSQKKKPEQVTSAQLALPDEKANPLHVPLETKEEEGKSEIRHEQHPPELSKPYGLRGATALTVLE